MWDDFAMDPEEAVTRLRNAVRRYKRATDAADRARTELGDLIAEAITAGVKPRDVVVETGFTAEHIRRLARQRGVEPLREPTVTSKRKAEQQAMDLRAAENIAKG
jgi:hypothetical protein